jgi:hypothetical protein
MHNINTALAIDYCRKGNNLLDASVHFKVDSTNAQYTSPPTVTFSGGSGITAATGHAILVDGRVVEVIVDTPGSGYSTAPTIAFSAGGGAGAAATATISGGAVDGTTVTASGGKRITFTDNTVYDTASGEARATVHIDLYDKFGNHKEFEITAADGDDAITVDLGGLNAVDGIDGQVLVVSNQDNKKDGSIYDLVLIRQEGDFVIEI